MSGRDAAWEFVDAMACLICAAGEVNFYDNKMRVPAWCLLDVNAKGEPLGITFDWELSDVELRKTFVFVDYHVMQRVRRRHFSMTQRFIPWGGPRASGKQVQPVQASASGPAPSFLQRLVRRWFPKRAVRNK